MEPTQTVCVVGLGYIGLPTAAILVANGNDVTGVDVNPRHVEEINAGRVPFVELDLQSVVAGVDAQSRLRVQAVMPHAGTYFKADIEDLRESPSKTIVEELAIELGHAKVLVVEPNVLEVPANLARLMNAELVETADAIQQAGAVLVLVDHHQFNTVDRELLREKIVIDTTGMFRWNRSVSPSATPGPCKR